MYALDYPQQVGEPPVVTQPDVIPGSQVHIPDPNLRAAIAVALGKSINAPITVEEIKGLVNLSAENKGIQNLTGLQLAANLRRLTFARDKHQFSDLTPIAGLNSLESLRFDGVNVSDLSPLSGLINLKTLHIGETNVSDLSPLAGLINLEWLHFDVSKVSDLLPLAGLINLKHIGTWGSNISDLSPLAGLTKLRSANICGAEVSDLAPLSDLTGLTELYLRVNEISDVSPLARLTGLTRLNLKDNNISDISALVGLTDLEWLNVAENNIDDVSRLAGLDENIKIEWYGNPGLEKLAKQGGPKIEGPWLWIYLPHVRLEDSFDTDFLSEATARKVTEVGVATDGATEGNPVGDEVWTSHKLPTTGRNNFHDMLGRALPRGLIYGNIYFYSPEEQDTTMYLGAHQRVKVWLNGELIYQRNRLQGGEENYTEFSSLTLHQGRNVLLIASDFHIEEASNGFFGFDSGTKYTLEPPGVGYAFSEMPLHVGDTFTLDIRAENIFDLAGWQFDIAFDPTVLEALDVSEGDFLKSDAGTTFFQGGRIDNAAGKITGLIAGRIADGGVSGSGSVLQVRFKAKAEGETGLTLQNFLFGSVTEESIPAGPLEIYITVEERLLTGDVNRDGVVNILDLIRVARQLGQRVSADSAVDINGDGVVNIFDLTLVAQGIGKTSAAAPTVATGSVGPATIEVWIAQARLADDGSIAFRQGIANLEVLLASMIPQETALLPNYPNPFNPETWIPYQLAVPAEVTLTIFDMNGGTIRHLEAGHQAAGTYQSRSRALHWDGRNQRGESVASGLYFYTLSAGEFTATRKMLIRK